MKTTPRLALLVALPLGLFPFLTEAQDAAQMGDYAPHAVAELKISSRGYPRMVFDPSGTRLAVSLAKQPGEDGKIAFLNVPDLEVVREIVTDTEPYGLAYSPSGDQFALSVAPENNPEQLRFAVLPTSTWSPPLHAERTLNYAVASLAYDPVGDLLFVGGSDRRELFRFSVATWTRESIPALQDIEDGCQVMALSRDGQYCAMGTRSSNLYVWRMDDTGDAKRLGTNRFEGSIDALAFSRDSKFMAAGDSRGRVMVFYRTSDDLWAWKGVFQLPAGGATGLVFLTDNSLVTASSYGAVSRWNIESPNSPVETMNLGATQTQTLALDPSGSWLAVGGAKVMLFPMGTPPAPSEMPPAVVTVVEREQPPTASTFREEVPSVPAVSEAPREPSGPDDLQSFLIWLAPGKGTGSTEPWIQAWAGYIDQGLYAPTQLEIPYETNRADVCRTNLDHLGEVFSEGDFLTFYVSAVLKSSKDDGDAVLSVGPYLNEEILLSRLMKALQSAASKGSVVWFLDLVPAPDLGDKAIPIHSAVVDRLSRSTEGLEPGATPYLREDIGTGLVTLSDAGCFKEIQSALRDALSGKADGNGDGALFDRELLSYLGDKCLSASRVDVVGNPKNEVPILPPFNLGTP